MCGGSCAPPGWASSWRGSNTAHTHTPTQTHTYTLSTVQGESSTPDGMGRARDRRQRPHAGKAHRAAQHSTALGQEMHVSTWCVFSAQCLHIHPNVSKGGMPSSPNAVLRSAWPDGGWRGDGSELHTLPASGRTAGSGPGSGGRAEGHHLWPVEADDGAGGGKDGWGSMCERGRLHDAGGGMKAP
jgi:hypothetical protein